MKLITFQKPNKFHFIFLAYFVVIFIREIINRLLKGSGNRKADNFFILHVYIISHILSFIPFLISRHLSKKIEKSDTNKIIKNYIENKIPKKYKWKNIVKPILIVSLFGFFAEAPMYLVSIISNVYDNMLYRLGVHSILNAVLIYIFGYCILKIFFYKHHYLSFGINSICFLASLIIDIILLIKLKIHYFSYYIYITVRVLRLIFHCILYCFSKKEFESSLLTPYSIIAFRSIFEIIFLCAFSIPFAFIPIKPYDKNEKEILFIKFKYFLTGINLLYSIILLILDYLIDLFIMIIIDKFSTSHVALAITLESFAEKLSQIIEGNINVGNVSWDNYVNVALYFMVFIGAMIHNEIFIINKCGLNEKTQLYLSNEFNKENIDIEREMNFLSRCNSNEEESNETS